MSRRMNKTDKECMERLNAVIDTRDYKTGLSMSVGSGGTRWIDEQLNAITEQYGGMTYLKNERIIGVGRVTKILVEHPADGIIELTDEWTEEEIEEWIEGWGV